MIKKIINWIRCKFSFHPKFKWEDPEKPIVMECIKCGAKYWTQCPTLPKHLKKKVPPLSSEELKCHNSTILIVTSTINSGWKI